MSALTQVAPPSRRMRMSHWADRNIRWVFIVPATIFVALMIVLPLGYTVVLSFTDASRSVTAPFDFVWFENYAAILTDTERFWPAAGRTALFTLATVSIEMVLGLGLAFLLRRPFRGQGWVRVAVLMPLVATPIAVATMWLLIFEPTIGFANQLLGWLGLPAQGWISDPAQAMPTLIWIDVWQWTPMIALILLAGLSSLPTEPDEAATVDGASNWQRLRYVTIPLLAPTITAAILLRSIDAMKTFDILYAAKGKGGGSNHEVETLNILAYGYNFDYQEYGLSSALLIVFLFLLCGLVVVMLLLRKASDRT